MAKSKKATGAPAAKVDVAEVGLPSKQVEELAAMLRQAGHFPRPVGARGRRMLRADTAHGDVFIDPVPEGYVKRIVERPDGEREEWTGRGSWQSREGWHLVSERRSAIDERVDAVRELHAALEVAVPPLLRAGFLPQPKAWIDLLADDLLDEVSVGAALASLNVAPQPVSGANGPKARTPIDVAHDAVCVLIRRALSKESNGLVLKALVARCGGTQKETTIKTRLRLLKTEGHVVQTGNRGAYRLTGKGAEQQRRD